MKRYPGLLFLLCLFVVSTGSGQNIVTYAGDAGNDRFYSVVQLSDSTYLAAGSSDDLNWVPAGVTRITLSAKGINNSAKVFSKYGYILHLASNLKTIKQILYFPSGTVQDIRHIKLTTVPGQATGSIYISGTTLDSRANAGGYFLAKLNNNFISGIPSDISWAYNVYATGYYQAEQPWDVGSDGKIVFVAGQPYGTDSAVVLRLKADGSGPDVVDLWRTHWGKNVMTGNNDWGHWSPSTANPFVQVTSSGIELLMLTRCDLRSWTNSDYSASRNDENGGTKKGTWPMDLFFRSKCDTATPAKSQTTPGYTGYSYGGANTLKLGAVTIDRRDNSIYLGLSTKAYLPTGRLDIEPFIIAFDNNGGLKWWSRMHEESSKNSWPQQEVSALGIDYSQSGNMAALIAVASTSGNTLKNFWKGDNVVNNPLNPGYSFHNKYTGTDTIERVSWIGRFRLTNGDLLNSAYIAAYSDLDPLTQNKYSEPIHDRWASHNAGNPLLNTADVNIDLQTDALGKVYILATARRFVTTSNAYQKMVKPSAVPTTAQFLRVYEPDLTKLAYSSALTGVWNTTTGSGGNNTILEGVYPVYNGAVIVGFHEDNNGDKKSDGNRIPLSHVPAWGDSTPKAEEAILARLLFDTVVKAYFTVNPKTGNCVGKSSVFTDTSYGATSWSWDFGSGSPSTATGKGPHTISWSVADTVYVRLIASNSSGSDTVIMPYIISSSPTSSFTFSGTTTSAPDTISFSGPSGTGISYSWDFGDPSSSGSNSSTLQNPQHIYKVAGTYRVRLIVTNGNCSDTTFKNVTITGGVGKADARFTFSPNPGCNGSEVIFTQTSNTNSIQWFWVFGSGAEPQTFSGKGPVAVKYITPGTKTVMLTVTNGIEYTTQTNSIVVYNPPTTGITFTGDTTKTPSTLILLSKKCNKCSYSWDFGDPTSVNNTSSNADMTHTFDHSSTYLVSLTVTDSNGCSKTGYRPTTIVSPSAGPDYADFTVTPGVSTCVNNPVKFTDMSRSDVKTRRWFFGSGAVPATSFSADTVTVKWTTAGTKTITLVAGSGSGESIKQKTIFYEVNDYPDATFTYSGNLSSAPANVSFSAQKADGYIYKWDFGDTTTSSNSSDPVHRYTHSGIYTVTLAVTHNGCTSYYAKNIYIGMAAPAIIPAFSVKPSKNGCASPYVEVTDLSSGSITSYSWNFGTGAAPGTSSTGGSHTIHYSSAGIKTIRLTVSNGTISQTATMTFRVMF